MNASVAALALSVVLPIPTVAAAQQNVGREHHGGLQWAVAAPQGASWRLDCRFRPVVMEMSSYDREHWANALTRQGSGADQGRLPGDNGRCTLTKTGGSGPVGLALIKDGVHHSDGTNDPSRPAAIDVF
ncbi:hypothetical protein [Brevundimonas sp.]|jgi:hypothetical protein|uniref:hypothetical protein n=1 Tax=Brevundimonas sp. TaxID=1871086 RepID=UPI002E10041A|nr:hypothetical protein [Brevundimonas sp.]